MSSTDIEQERPATDVDLVGGARMGDKVFSGLSVGSGVLIFATLAAVAYFLIQEATPAIRLSTEVMGSEGEFSLLDVSIPVVFGTVLSAVLALLIAVPIAVGVALFISHLAPRRLASPIGYMMDLLAAVPSVVFGLWGGVWLVPRLEPLFLFLHEHVGWFPLFGGAVTPPMRNMATAAVVLAVMILPIITAVAREVFLQTPRLTEEAALALGATRWEVIKTVVLPFGRNGVVAASMLGLGRALGETMAVLMIMSPGMETSFNILVSTEHSTIASYIARKQAEAGPDEMSLLIFTGLVLFVLTFVINALARLIVARTGTKA